ncbi:DUF4252 domain-containing protein [Hymenobacter sp. BT507]|uniref:DUF4252 domain-containing protein n=1 Tax=Hymenobacter citatus TaxID=2763506 RepID=A0ABR7MJ48_9BACT|nr:DUF4252 domain-containing protein [Hymenobacter citatus]MBC6610617.1 DUF4252 domain-containing protein [Hymenobacter citatus]
MKRYAFSLVAALVLLLSGCRASGPGTPARTVAEFFRKYDGRPGFRTTEWSAGLTTRLLLGRLGKLGGDNDLAQALSSIRSCKVLAFTPTSAGALKLTNEGLSQEVDGLLRNERYTPLAVSAPDNNTALRYAIRQQGDQVQEMVATGHLSSSPNSFVLLDVSGNFTRAQAERLAEFLPNVVHETTP